jgi:hypothetical protein
MDDLASAYYKLSEGAEGYDAAVDAIINGADDLISVYEEYANSMDSTAASTANLRAEIEKLKNA